MRQFPVGTLVTTPPSTISWAVLYDDNWSVVGELHFGDTAIVVEQGKSTANNPNMWVGVLWQSRIMYVTVGSLREVG